MMVPKQSGFTSGYCSTSAMKNTATVNSLSKNNEQIAPEIKSKISGTTYLRMYKVRLPVALKMVIGINYEFLKYIKICL